MIQELLTDIELDVQQMKYMLDSISKEEDPTLRILMKRMIQRTHERLNQIQSELESAPVDTCISSVSSVNEETDVEVSVVTPFIPNESNSEKTEDVEPEKTVKEEMEALPVLETLSSVSEIIPPVKEIPSSVLESATPVLGESIWTSTDFRRSISLNDSFRFTREIFDGDSELMNRIIEQISAMSTYSAAVAFLASKVTITEENEAMNDLLELLKKHFKSA